MRKDNIRIAHIDAIRGLMILLVIYIHIVFFLLKKDDTYMCRFFSSIRMPLFFFIAGFFMYSSAYTKELFNRRATNRIIRQLYPTIFFWTIFSLIFTHDSFPESWLMEGKSGYWFTFVLVEMFFIVVPFLMLFYQKKYSNFQKTIYLILFCLAIEIIYYTNRLLPNKIIPEEITGFLSFNMLAMYLPYLIFGIISNIYINNFNKLNRSLWWSIASVLTFTVTLWLINKLSVNFIFSILSGMVLSLSGIMMIFNIFYMMLNSKIIASFKLIKSLIFIGKFTLEIYLIHYFIIFIFKSITGSNLVFDHLTGICNTIFEFPILIMLSIVIASICVSIVYIIKKARLYKYFFPNAISSPS